MSYLDLDIKKDLESRVLLLECVGEKEEKELETWFRQAPLLELPSTLLLYKLFEFEEEGFS